MAQVRNTVKNRTVSQVAEAALADADAVLAQGYAIADQAVNLFTVDDTIDLFGRVIALRELVVIFRRPVQRYRATDVTSEGRKAGDAMTDPMALFRGMLDTLPDQQFVAMCALVDGREARTYEQAARKARMSLGAFKQHLHRIRSHYPALYAQIMAYRSEQLQQRHADAEKRARRHTTEWFWKLRRLEERSEAIAKRVEAAYRRGLAEHPGWHADGDYPFAHGYV